MNRQKEEEEEKRGGGEGEERQGNDLQRSVRFPQEVFKGKLLRIREKNVRIYICYLVLNLYFVSL
jgi:hypothetical protein